MSAKLSWCITFMRGNMHRYSSPYPISKVIDDLIRQSGDRRSAFVRRIGYRRVNSALRVLDSWLVDGEGDRLFLERLVEVFPEHGDAVAGAAGVTAQEKRREREHRRLDRERKLYSQHTPCLIAESDGQSPRQLVLYALCGRDLKVIRLPQRIVALSNDRAFQIVRWKIKRYLRIFNGQVPFWGEARSFLFSKRPDENYAFNLQGELLQPHGELPGLFRATLAVSVRR